ncbi:MAG: efflux RND transporter periplasmic adaptor subunit [Desulfobacteraceae bacterium]|nr:efflux RND transporter periplasmic adaptor subunit [Desulfobacteraceae bacterium]MBC2754503.1 efflux RND transporter periplasmic adaptor subunit [Desulfobacteraceae bacterium]
MLKKKIIFMPALITGLLFILAITVHGEDQKEKQTTPITISTVKSQTILITEESVGRIEARFAPLVSAEETGLIVEIFAETGRHVVAGDMLVQIDNQAYCLAEDARKAEVQRLEALIANQKKTVERYRNLLAKKSIPQDRMDTADMNLAALKVQLDAANAGLADATRRKGKTQCVAPISGWIEKRFVTTGDFVNTGKPLFKITSDENLRIVLPFPESVASKFKKGQKVLLNTPTTPDIPVESTISKIRPSVNVSNRAVEIIVDIDNPGSWRPGASINGTVIINEQPDTNMVPDKSVIRRPAGDVVYVIDQNIARERKVITGLRIDDFLEIVNGLSKGDVIAVYGANYLTDNALVQVQENN